ncbi:MAG TPA: hypothetical protein VIL18_01510 [Longimicrobiales bacterium]
MQSQRVTPGDLGARAHALPHASAASMTVLARLRATTLSLEAPDPLAGEALEQAKLRLAGVRGGPADEPRGGAAADTARGEHDAAWVALACLATGQAELVADLLRSLSRRRDTDAACAARGEPPARFAESSTAPYPLLAAAYAAWTADLAALGGEAFDDGVHEPTALLPDAGSPPDPLLASARESLAAYAAGRSEAAFGHWWRCVQRLVADGAQPREDAHADRITAGSPPEVAAANIVVPLVYGLLGVEPDALRHRLRLRLQPPAAWDRLHVERLRVGDAEVSLRYCREGARHTLCVEQTRGAVPLRLVLEPLLPARRLANARVDGRDARLDARPAGERLLVPIQLVLDHERSLEVYVEYDPDDDAV